MSDKLTIEDLQRQIAELQERLRIEQQKKDSLWNGLYELFLAKIYNGEETEESEASCKSLATLVADKMSDWVFRQRQNLGEKIAKSGRIRMPAYTDCLNDLVFSLSPPGMTRYKAVEPVEEPAMEADITTWDEGGTELPLPPEARERSLEAPPQPLEKLNSFSKRVNVPRPRKVSANVPEPKPENQQ